MKLNRLFLIFTIFCATLNAYSQKRSKTIYVPKPGTMMEMLTEEEANQITYLRLQGRLNAIDFRNLRDGFKQLRTLDLSEASISLYTGKNGTSKGLRIYPANTLPALAFCQENNDSTFHGKESLRRVIQIGRAHV